MLLLCAVLLENCMTINRFEQNIQIPNHQWKSSYEPEIKFEISDTLSSYNVYVTIRHTDAYAYRNIWLDISSLHPGDTTYQKGRFELTLQQSDGKWLGTGYGDIWEVRYPLFNRIRFIKKGTYAIRLRQIMRDDPLKHIMNAGIRIEKSS
jgi:gliding motility-associated lipoprotein GldH